jgi:hypothetical protein
MIWLGGLVLFAVAAGGIWYSVTRTDYLPRLAVWMIKQAIPIIMKRNSPEIEEKMHQAFRQAMDWDNWRKRPKRDEH